MSRARPLAERHRPDDIDPGSVAGEPGDRDRAGSDGSTTTPRRPAGRRRELASDRTGHRLGCPWMGDEGPAGGRPSGSVLCRSMTVQSMARRAARSSTLLRLVIRLRDAGVPVSSSEVIDATSASERGRCPRPRPGAGRDGRHARQARRGPPGIRPALRAACSPSGAGRARATASPARPMEPARSPPASTMSRSAASRMARARRTSWT